MFHYKGTLLTVFLYLSVLLLSNVCAILYPLCCCRGSSLPWSSSQMNFKSYSSGCFCELLARRSEGIREMPDVTQEAKTENISSGFLWLCSSEVTVHVQCLPLNSPSLGWVARVPVSKSTTKAVGRGLVVGSFVPSGQAEQWCSWL